MQIIDNVYRAVAKSFAIIRRRQRISSVKSFSLLTFVRKSCKISDTGVGIDDDFCKMKPVTSAQSQFLPHSI